MLWLKAFHVVAWSPGSRACSILPRLFVYHADATDALSVQRFQIMERRLYAIMSIGAAATIALGVWMIALAPWYLSMGWLHVKLALVALLIAITAIATDSCASSRSGRNTRTAPSGTAFSTKRRRCC
jgi:protoporphyrinogen IX oxidase